MIERPRSGLALWWYRPGVVPNASVKAAMNALGLW
jgi:hypothetical protein